MPSDHWPIFGFMLAQAQPGVNIFPSGLGSSQTAKLK